MGEVHTVVRSSTEGYHWRLRVQRNEFGEPDKYGQRKVAAEMEQEIGGNTATEAEAWSQLNAAKATWKVNQVA